MSDPWAPFVPVQGRRVALGFAAVSIVLFAVLALVVPRTGLPGWGVVDSSLLFGFGVLVAAFMWRLASLRALPSRQGLLVRNILVSRAVRWSDVRAVRFAGGDPWVVLDLTDGDQLAVMAVQKADGERGRADASRLAALVQAGQRAAG